MAARTGRPYKLQVLSTNGERKLQGSANNPTDCMGNVSKNVLPAPFVWAFFLDGQQNVFLTSFEPQCFSKCEEKVL